MVSLESIVNRQIRNWELQKEQRVKEGVKTDSPKPVITVSRQQGSRGSFFAKKIAERFGFELFHRELIDFICKDSGARRRVIESMDEKHKPDLELWLEGILKGKIVDTSDYAQWLAKAIYSVASHGNAVIIGRGANYILKMSTGLHLRIVASHSRRISNLIEYKGLTVKEAEKNIEESDRAREEFVEKNFGYDIADPTHYDLVMNSEYFDIETALEIVEKALLSKMHLIGQKDGNES